MECRINDVLVHYVEHGVGVPLVALHGAGVDHREIEAAIEAIPTDMPCRRLYPDLPGMGRSTADGLTCNDDVVTLLGDFIDRLGAGPVLLLGHSYGGHGPPVPRPNCSNATRMPRWLSSRTPAMRSCTSGPNYSPRCSATGSIERTERPVTGLAAFIAA